MYNPETFYDRPATKSEACIEYARNVGAEHPEREFIITDYDTVERNPFYTGQKHDQDIGEDIFPGLGECEDEFTVDENGIPF